MFYLSDVLVNFTKQDCVMVEVMVENQLKYLYIDQNTYNQIVILDYKYQGNRKQLREDLGLGDTASLIGANWHNAVPAPLGIVGVFIGLVQGVSSNLSFEEMCGLLHQLSSTIDFVQYLNVPAEVRAKVNLDQRALLSYKASWDAINYKFKTSDFDVDQVPYEAMKQIVSEIVGELKDLITSTVNQQPQFVMPPYMAQPYPQMPMQAAPVAPVATQEEEEEEFDPETAEVDVEDPFAFLANAIEALNNKTVDSESVNAYMDDMMEGAGVSKVDESADDDLFDSDDEDEDEVVPHEPTEEEKKLDNIDNLIARMSGMQ